MCVGHGGTPLLMSVDRRVHAMDDVRRPSSMLIDQCVQVVEEVGRPRPTSADNRR